MENPWLLSKFARPRLLQGLGLASSEQVPFLQTHFALSSEKKNFQHNMSCYWLPEQVSGLTFLRAPVQFPLIWYFWILGIDGKPLTFMKMSLTKTPPRSGPCSFGASSIPANVYGIDFWKELSNTTRPSIGHQSNFLPWPFTRAPYHFPFIWYFITQVLIENPWLSSKFAVQGFSKVWALLLWSNFHSWKCFFD